MVYVVSCSNQFLMSYPRTMQLDAALEEVAEFTYLFKDALSRNDSHDAVSIKRELLRAVATLRFETDEKVFFEAMVEVGLYV